MKGQGPRADALPADGTIGEGSSLRTGERVVYPNQGVCRVAGVEWKEIAGQKLEMVRLEREEDGAAVLVPRAKVVSVGLRRVASRDYVEGVFHFLAAQADDPELDWKIRHRDNADRLVVGGVLGVAEVVKGLHALSRIRPLPTKEREQYDNARHLLVAEIAAALAVPPVLAEDYVDHALMPPAGVRFQLRPPPKPVELPIRIRHRPPVRAEEDDLGLGELGIALEEEPAEGPAVAGEGETPAEAGAGGGEDEPEAVPPARGGRPAREKPAAKPALKPPAKPPAKKPGALRAAKREKPPRKAPARRPARKAAKKKGAKR